MAREELTKNVFLCKKHCAAITTNKNEIQFYVLTLKGSPKCSKLGEKEPVPEQDII